jgi:hypothetical protein
MTTLVIDRQTLPEALLSFIGSPRVLVLAESDRVVLTPAAADEADDSDDSEYEFDIDPADYEDETAYVNAIPGLAESLLASRNLPDSEFEEVPREYFNA